jgi:two-component system response regulator DevR
MSHSEKKRIRLIMVDDSEVVRMGLRSLLGAEPSIEVIGEAGNVERAVEVCAQLKPDVVLLDIRLPDGTGFDACRRILKLSTETRALILTSVADNTLVDEAIRVGAHGYLLKDIDGRGLIRAITDVAAGRSILDPSVTARVIQLVKGGAGHDALAILSPQERNVLALIADGHTNKEVANRLGLAEKTVKNYLSNVFEKLHVTRRAQAAAMFVRESRGPSYGAPAGNRRD